MTGITMVQTRRVRRGTRTQYITFNENMARTFFIERSNKVVNESKVTEFENDGYLTREYLEAQGFKFLHD